MSTSKFKPNVETKIPFKTLQQQEDIQQPETSMAEKLAEKMQDQFLNEKAIDIESLAQRFFAANPNVVDVKGDAYILHQDGTKTFLKPEDKLKGIILSEGDVIVTAPNSSVIIEAAGKQCTIDANSELPIMKAVLMTIDTETETKSCPGTLLVEDDGHSFIISDYWEPGKAIAAYGTTSGLLDGTLSGDYLGVLTEAGFLSELPPIYSTPIRGGEGELGSPLGPTVTVVLGGPEAAPIVPPIATPPAAPPDDGNQPPVANASIASGSEDQPLVFSMAMFNSTDPDAGDSVDSVTITSLPTDGILEINDPILGWIPVNLNQEIPASEIDLGNFRFTPEPNESGDDSFGTTSSVGNLAEDYASFNFTLSDGTEISNEATMAINIAPIGDPSTFINNVASAVQAFAPVYMVDTDGITTTIYSVTFGSDAAVTPLASTGLLIQPDMAVTEDGSRIYLLEANGGSPVLSYYDTTNDSFNAATLNAPGLESGGMTFFADDTGNELLYISDDVTNTLTSYDVSTGNAEVTYGPFLLVDADGNSIGGTDLQTGNFVTDVFFDFDRGDIIFDEFGQAFAVSNSLNGNDPNNPDYDPALKGGLVKLNLDLNTAELIQDFSDWNQTIVPNPLGGSLTISGLDRVTSLYYDVSTQTLAVGINNAAGGSSTYSPTNEQVSSAFIIINRDGSYLVPGTSSTVDMTLNGAPFDHTAGDTGSAITGQYDVPVDALLFDTDGSEAIIQLRLDLNDTLVGDPVDGAAIVYNGQVISAGDTIDLSAEDSFSNPLPPIQALVSVDPVNQIWTFDIQNPNPAAVTVSGDFAVRVGIAQNTDFQVIAGSTTMELSNGSTGTVDNQIYDVQIDFVPIINDGAALIIHDEDSLVQPGTDDVDEISTVPPQAITDFETANPLLVRLGMANNDMGDLAYQAPGGDYITDIRFSQSGVMDVPFANDGVLGGVDSGIRTAGDVNHIFLYQHPSDNNMLIGREGSGSAENLLGNIIFTIYLDGGFVEFGSPNDSVWLTTYGNIENSIINPAVISNLIHLTVETDDGSVATSSDSIDFEIHENDNDAPVTSDSIITLGEDLTYVFTIADFPSTDADVGDDVEFVRFDTLPVSGTIQLNGSNISAGQSISVADINGGLLTYIAESNQSGDPSFPGSGTGDQENQYALATFSVSDGQVFSGAPSQMSVEVTPIADAPLMGAGITTIATLFSTKYISDAGAPVANPDFNPYEPVSSSNPDELGGGVAAGADLYKVTFDDNGTPGDISDDIAFLTDKVDLYEAAGGTMRDRVDGRAEWERQLDADDYFEGQFGSDINGPGSYPIYTPGLTTPGDPYENGYTSDVGYTTAAIAAVLDGSQIYALDDRGSNIINGTSRLDFGFYDTATGGFTNISGPPSDDGFDPEEGVTGSPGHADDTTQGVQGMTFFGGGGEEQIFVYNVNNDTIEAFDISNDTAPDDEPFDPLNSRGVFGDLTNGFLIIDSPDRDNNGVGDHNGLYYDMQSGDIIFDQYDQVYMISNSRLHVNNPLDINNPVQVGGFAKLNLEDGTAVLLNDFRDQFNLEQIPTGQPGPMPGLGGVGGLFFDAETNTFFIANSGTIRFYETGDAGTPGNQNDGDFVNKTNALIAVDRQGNVLSFATMVVPGDPTFVHASLGDATSTIQVQYSLPLLAAITDSDGSESLTQIRIDLSDVDNSVSGGMLRYDHDLDPLTASLDVIDGSGNIILSSLSLDGFVDNGGGPVAATINATVVSYDVVNQIYTLDLDQSGGNVVGLSDSNHLNVTADGNQVADFNMNVQVTSTELSNFDTATGQYDVFVDRGGIPQIDAVGSISIDETAGVQTTDDGFGVPVDDVDQTALTDQDQYNQTEGFFTNMQNAEGLLTPIAIAHTNPGEMLYLVPSASAGNPSFAGDVTMTQWDGSAFNGVDSGLTSVNGNTIFLYTYNNPANVDPLTGLASDDMIVGREGGFLGDPNAADPTGAVIFSLFYDHGLTQFGAANDTLWLTMYDNILHESAGQSLSINDLIYLTVFDDSLSASTTSTQAITVTFVDDPADVDGPDPFPPPAPFMMMSAFSAGDGPVSNEDASSSFMTVSTEDSSELLFATVSNEDPSTVDDGSSDDSSPSQDSSDTGSDQALTNEMVFDTESQDNPVQAEQQATLDGSGTQPQEEVAQQQQTQEATADPSAAAAPDAVSQSMQEADQQAQSSGG